MAMHAARADRSGRLQRVLGVIGDHQEHSTLDIVTGAAVCAVSAIVAELRANGYTITCRQGVDRVTGARVWFYRLHHG